MHLARAPLCETFPRGSRWTRSRRAQGSLTGPLHRGNIPWLITLIRAMGRKTMQRVLSLLAIGVCANALVNLSAAAQGTPEVTLTRFECGTSQAPTEVNLRFSDTYAYGDLKLQFVFSCYLIK